MKNKFFNNLITSILISSFILIPYFSVPKKAGAQLGGSIAGYTSGLIPAITQLPQCKEVIDSGTKSLFSGIGSLFSSEKTQEELDAEIADQLSATGTKALNEKSLNAEVNSLRDLANSINVVDINSFAELMIIKGKIDKIEKSTASINANSTCIQSIGRLIIKMLLQKLTVSTVNWINSGFDGSPAFVQDPGKFFNDIAKNEILQFGIEINNPELFPFGKAWMQNQARAFNNKFQTNAQYSLDKLIQDTNPEFTAATFQQDFSMGGWDAWSAMTQIPANNPLGFKLMADNEIQKRLAGTAQSVAQNTRDALQAANGFLGDQRCAEPKGVTREEHENALKERGGSDTGPYQYRSCEKWEYVTPGKMISDKATEVIGYPNNAYLNVEDLNDAVAAILDSLLGQFSSNLMEKGFANLGNRGADGALVYEAGNIYNPYKSQSEQDFTPVHLTSSWLKANPNFNIREDLTQALIDEQRTYSDKLKLQNKELLSTTDGLPYKINESTGISNAYGLIPVIDQLDYCIPGPHPGWEEDSRRTLAAATNVILPETKQSLEDQDIENIIKMAQSILPMAGAAIGATVIAGWLGGLALGATLGSAVPVVGTIVGAIVGTLIGLLIPSGDENAKVRAYYATIIQNFTGSLPDYLDDNDDRTLNLLSKAGAVNVLNTILDRYAVIANKIYYSNPEILPTVAKEATTSFNQLTGYGQMVKNNEDKISLLKTTVNILGEIKNEIDKLNKDFPNGGDEYENKLKAQINAFGRLSSGMVNGDDIAEVDNLLKQIIDKKDYIYKNLLKGPYGCEAFLENEKNIIKFPSAGSNIIGIDWSSFDVNSVKRMTYPFPIIYNYNNFEKGATLPDPWNSGYKTEDLPKMPANNRYNEYGPGFLSFVVFGEEENARRGGQRLKVDDILPMKKGPSNRYDTALGIRVQVGNDSSFGISGCSNFDAINPDGLVCRALRGGPFETIIGIY